MRVALLSLAAFTALSLPIWALGQSQLMSADEIVNTSGSLTSAGSRTAGASTQLTATTPPPLIISDVRTSDITETGTRIYWVTNLPATSKVAFGANETALTEGGAACDGGGTVTDHCVLLSNLTPSTNYFYIVRSNTSASAAYSTIATFSTASRFSADIPERGNISPEIPYSQPAPTTAPTTAPPQSAQPTTSAVAPGTYAPRTYTEPTAGDLTSSGRAPYLSTEDQLQAMIDQLEGVDEALRTFRTESKEVENTIKSTAAEGLEHAIELIAGDESEQSRLRDQLSAPKAQLSQELTDVINNVNIGAQTGPQSGIQSTFNQIQTTIQSQTGFSVDFTPTTRKLSNEVSQGAGTIEAARAELLKRDGQDLYEDTDHDGISDYDEKHIYKSDPFNAYTSGSQLTDGERILLGLDVHTRSDEQVPVESPMHAGLEAEGIYEVYSIEVKHVPVEATTNASTSSPTLPAFDEQVAFSGRALPNSFVTLYIFSTPIVVTIKTDLSGAWRYTLDAELPDGEHQLYVATVDSGGKIVAKSPAIPFIKTAEAAEFTPLLIGASSAADPLDTLRENLLVLAVGGVLVFAVVGVMILGARRERMGEPTATS